MSPTTFNRGQTIGLIPARGGSKSIPLKNIALIAGKPLIAYVIEAACKSKCLARVLCSTDHQMIATACRERGIEVIERPEELGLDDTPVTAVIIHALETLARIDGHMPEMVALLQPTSPFLLPEHIERCVKALAEHPDADSAQTITPVFHNAHAFNQRVIENDRVRFRFAEERRAAFNKQLKPKHYLFGNLVVTRSRSLIAGKDCFGDVSVAVEIPRTYALDVDTADDVDYATYLVKEGKIALG